MNELGIFLSRLINMERVGGRLHFVGETQLVLHDCMQWPHDFSEAVTEDFPDVFIDVRGSRNSLSGFVVVFTRAEGHRPRTWWLIGIAVGVSCCAMTLMASPWWVGAYRALRSI